MKNEKALLLMLFVCVFYCHSYAHDKTKYVITKELQKCIKNSDCVYVNTACDGCTYYEGINSKYSAKFRKEKIAYCDGYKGSVCTVKKYDGNYGHNSIVPPVFADDIPIEQVKALCEKSLCVVHVKYRSEFL